MVMSSAYRLSLLVLILLVLPGCVDTRSPSKEIIDDPGEAGWVPTYDGRIDRAQVEVDATLIHTNLSVLPAISGWVRVWEKDSSRISVGLFYTAKEVANPLAGARRLRRTIDLQPGTWTREFDHVRGAVTLELPGETGTRKWVYGANKAFVFAIGWEGVSPELIGEVFESQMAALPEFDPFDSIRPGVALTYLLVMLLALGYGVRLHRERLRGLEGTRVEVFP